MIRFKCPGCSKVLQAPPTAAGKIAKCNQCQTRIKVPSPKATSQQNTTTNTSSQSAAFLAAPTTSPNALPNQSIGETTGSLFDELPEFSAPSQPVPKPAGNVFDDSLPPAGSLTVDLTRPTPLDADLASEPIDFSSALDQAVDLANTSQKHQLQKNARAAGAKLTKQQVAKSFAKQIDPIDKAGGYGASLTKVAATMIVLPTLFVTVVVALTGVIIWLTVRWMSSEETGLLNPFIFFGVVGVAVLTLAAWIPVMTMLSAVFSFVFSGRPERPGTRTISRQEQPVLYEFVDQICQKLNAPPPTRIDVNCEYNASASFDRGWLSFNKKEYVLTIGVPLIASHSTEQLASVVAHEFGHFCQSGGMRAHYMICHLNGWFIQSAIEKTIRDEVNDYVAANSDLGAFGFLWTIYYLIGYIGRQLLFCFGRAGHAFSGTLSREMEYDADKYAVYLAGSKHFATSMTQVEKHAVAYSVTVDNLQAMFQHGILVRNIPRFMMYIAKTMPGSVVRKIADQMEKAKQDAYDSHPPTRDRINAAKELAKPSIVSIGRPASDLIRQWNQLCENITLDFYSAVTGRHVTSDHVSKLEDVLAAEHKLLLDKTE